MTDTRRLRRIVGRVSAFTDGWHAEPWTLGRLHWALDVPVVIEDGGGWGVLGVTAADGGWYAIGLSGRVVDTRLLGLTLAHEGSHVLLGVSTPTWCRCAWVHRREECDAWLATSLLAISEALTGALRRRELSAGELQYHTSAPPPMIRMRVAIDEALRRAGWRSRFLAEIGQAQLDLQAWMEREVAWQRAVVEGRGGSELA